MPKDSEEVLKKQLVKAIIGNIRDFNLDDEELENCYMSDEEVEDLDWNYDRALEAGEILPLTEEEKQRSKTFIKNISTYMTWAYTYRGKGLKEPYDFQEWVQIAEKPEEYK